MAPTPTPSPEPVAEAVVPSVNPGVFVEVPSPEPTPAPTPEPTPEPVVVEAAAPEPTPEPTPEPAVVEAAPVVETAPVAAAASVGEAPTDYKSAVLYHHNVHRSNHSAPALTYSDELASYAATLVSRCVFAHDTAIGGGGYGQNLAQNGGSNLGSDKDPKDLVPGVISNMWYNGELPLFRDEYYGQAQPDMSDFMSWGHFSQVVWKGTTTVGCSTQFCSSSSMWLTACNYGAAGNMGGAYAANVGKPLGNPTVSP